MLRDTLEMNIKRIVDFLIYSKNFIIRKSPLKALANSILEGLKDFLTMKEIENGSISFKLSQTSVSENGTVDCRE